MRPMLAIITLALACCLIATAAQNSGARRSPSASGPLSGPNSNITYRGWDLTRKWCIPDLAPPHFCSGKALRNVFESNLIVPDLLGLREMNYNVGVKLGFPGRLDVAATYVNKSAAVNPVVTFSPNAFNAANGGLHSIILLDPDASSRWNTTGSGPILHWLVTNIANGTVANGNVIQPFRPPGPAFGNGLHRYTLLLLKQRNEQPINVPPINQADATSRRRFDLYGLLRTYNLKVLGGTFFFSQF